MYDLCLDFGAVVLFYFLEIELETLDTVNREVEYQGN